MFQIVVHKRLVGKLFSIGLIAMLFAGCGTTTTSVPQPVQRGQWQRPNFQNILLPTVSAVTFTEANQQIGYTCVATLKSGVATPGATGTVAASTATATTIPSPTATAVPTVSATGTPSLTPTPTIGIPGRPSPPPSAADIANSLWSTGDGGLTWQHMTLPTQDNTTICPLSAIAAPDLANPQDIFLLLASGTFDITNPIAISPNQVHYTLWRSQNGGNTWSSLAIPSAPNPIVPIVLSPYHITITMQGQTLLFGSVYPDNTVLFASTNGGTSWNFVAPQTVQSSATDTKRRAFVSFAPANGSGILALMSSPAVANSDEPYEIWRSSADGTQWTFVNTVPVKGGIPTNGYAQIFASPIANIITVIAQQNTISTTTATGTTIPATVTPNPTSTAQTTLAAATSTPAPESALFVHASLFRSGDGGITWSANLWPATTDTGLPLGGSLIATYGLNCTVLSNGDTYFAPTLSDFTAAQDPHAAESAGIYRTTGSVTALIAKPVDTARTILGFNVSLTPIAVLQGTPLATTTATDTSTPVSTATTVAAATGTPSATSTVNATATSTAIHGSTPTGTTTASVAILWANFGPLQNLDQNITSVGLYQYILP